MIVSYVVEYKFSNCFGEICKRQRFQGNLSGLTKAIEKFQKGVKYIKYNQSEDFESVSIFVDTTTNGIVLYKSWDTELGYRFGNVMEAYVDG